MYVQDLIDALETMNPEAEVRLASQPHRPLEYRIEDVVEVPGEAARPPVIYIAEGGQVGYLPSEAREELGW